MWQWLKINYLEAFHPSCARSCCYLSIGQKRNPTKKLQQYWTFINCSNKSSVPKKLPTFHRMKPLLLFPAAPLLSLSLSHPLLLLRLPTFNPHCTHLWFCFCHCPTKIGLGLSGVPFQPYAMWSFFSPLSFDSK